MGNKDVAELLRQVSLADTAIPHRTAVRRVTLARSSITFGDGKQSHAHGLGG